MHRELLRRILYYGSFFVAIILAMYVCLEPLVIIDIFDPSIDNRTYARRYAESLLSEEAQEKIAAKRKAQIESDTIDVDDRQWHDIYDSLKRLKEGRDIPQGFKKRLPSNQYPSKVFFFRPYEPPVNTIENRLIADNQRMYLRLSSPSKGSAEKDLSPSGPPGQGARYLKLDYKIISSDDFHIGSGFSRYPKPPTHMLYPYRNISLWVLLFGLICYIFIPTKAVLPGSLRYPRWRVILGDLAASIMTFLFFAMPFFIIGGFVQAFKPYFLFSAVFWLISLLGVYSIKIALWYASYEVAPAPDGIKIATYKGARHLSFDAMEYFQPILFKPPKWLIAITWIAALSGRGGAGRAILTGLSEAGSIGIKLKDGHFIFIVVTDQMGTTALKGFEEIIETLRKKGIKELKETRVIRSMGFEIMR